MTFSCMYTMCFDHIHPQSLLCAPPFTLIFFLLQLFPYLKAWLFNDSVIVIRVASKIKGTEENVSSSLSNH